MLVTSVSPVLGLVCLIVPVTSPAALTDTCWDPALPRNCRSYCSSSPDWPTRSTPENPVLVRCRRLTSCGVMGCRYPMTWAAAVLAGPGYRITGWTWAVTPGNSRWLSITCTASLADACSSTGIG
jgi:hypothetical protein